MDRSDSRGLKFIVVAQTILIAGLVCLLIIVYRAHTDQRVITLSPPTSDTTIPAKAQFIPNTNSPTPAPQSLSPSRTTTTYSQL